MCKRIFVALLTASFFLALSSMPGARASDDDDSTLKGTWAINFIVPVSPKGNDFGQPHRHKFDFSEKNGERTVVAREILGLLVPGAWRASGDEFSATFEFSCDLGVTCGTVTMRGRLNSDTRMSGRVIVIWESSDPTTPTGFDTVTGTFTGERCMVRPNHDTGGCDAP